MESTKVAPSAIVLELLNLDNYEHWSRRVKTYLLAEGLWKVVEEPDPKPEDDAWIRQNAKALHVIHISCGSVIFSLISDFSATETATEAWNMLARKFKFVHTARHENNHANVALPEPYVAFFTKIHRDVDWGEVGEILERHREAVRIRHPKTGRTGLHMAVLNEDAQMVESMVPYMEKEDLEIEDFKGRTAFNYAALTPHANIKIVKCLVNKNIALVSTPITLPPYENAIPVALAVSYSNSEVANYLYELTPLKDLKPENGPSGADIITTCILKNEFDIAWNLIQRCPNLAITQDFSGNYPLNLLAGMRSAFLSGTPLTFYERWIYECIHIEDFQTLEIDEENQTDPTESGIHIEDVQVVVDIDIHEDIQMDPIVSAMGREVTLPFWHHIGTLNNAIRSFFHEIFMALLKLLGLSTSHPEIDAEVLGMPLHDIQDNASVDSLSQNHRMSFTLAPHHDIQENAFVEILSYNHRQSLTSHPEITETGIFDRIYKMKLVHVRVHQLLACMSKVTKCDDIRQLHDSKVQKAIFRAVQDGHVEFVTTLVVENKYINAVDICDKRGRNFFKFAVECRQEKVYNLIYDCKDEFIDRMGKTVDNHNNSLLHIVGSLSPLSQLNHIRDAALQMQRELQWLKVVESFVSPTLNEFVNRVDNMIGRELFTKNHKELVKEGEKSMKETATSCTVVGALITTIMFAAAFTVAGGNNQNTGLPMFLDDRLFMVFIVSDALSLFASTTSILIFLGILTSRYAEGDFLTSLPTKMMVGLLTLFFSIATMMVAFSTTLIIMLHDKYSWIVVPIIVLACIPITSFGWMQFPLLVEISVSTYGRGIFRKRHSHYSRRHRLKMFYARMKGKVVRAFSLTSKDKV